MPVALGLVALLFIILAPSLLRGQNISEEANETATWSYNEPHGNLDWSVYYPHCGGKRQSPIDIEAVVPATYKDLRIKGIKKNLSPANLTNNGHTVVLTVSEHLGVAGGPLTDFYKFIQLHFHWGSVDNYGSEHTLHNQTFSMEMHLVFLKRQYDDLVEAVKHSDGIAVLAVWLQEVKHDNPALNPVTDVLNQTIDENNVTIVKEPLRMADLLPKNLKAYYHYNGSLTTPGCEEAVKWIIFQEVVGVGRKQLRAFRKLKEGLIHPSALLSNHRPVQALNGRRVEKIGSNAAPWLGGGTPLLVLFTSIFVTQHVSRW